MGKSNNSEQSSIETVIDALRHASSVAAVHRLEIELRKLIAANGTPVVRGDKAHFFFEGPAGATVAAAGDWNNWGNSDLLEPLNSRSRFSYLVKTFPFDARVAYRMILNGKEFVLDPMNTQAEQEVFGTNSVVKMSAYREELLARPPLPEAPRGKLRELEIEGNKGNLKRNYTRTVQIYVPAETRRLSRLPVLYVHDGPETIAIGRFVNILDNLFYSEPLLPKCVVVFVPPKDRNREYMLHPGFAQWLVHHLVPAVETKLKLRPDPSLRGTLGSSLGGLLSAQLGFLSPKTFGAIAAQSPAFWVEDDKIIKMFAATKQLPLRFYIQTGVINDAQVGSRKMLVTLQDKGYPVVYRENNESHNWANWRGSYADIIRWFVTRAAPQSSSS